MSQSYLKAISIESPNMVYHNKGCQYALRMKSRNKTIVTKREAKQMGYRPCRYCNSMNYHFRQERSRIERFAKSNRIEIHFQNGIIYVKTEIGLWKIVYSREKQRCVLYHGNQPYRKLDIQEADTAWYHRQADKKFADTIMDYMVYIQKHDKYRKQVQEAGGDEMAVQVSKKYAVQRDRRMRRQAHRRIDHIFAALEEENPEYAKLAFC